MLMLTLEVRMYSLRHRSSSPERRDAREETSAFSASVKIRGTPAQITMISPPVTPKVNAQKEIGHPQF